MLKIPKYANRRTEAKPDPLRRPKEVRSHQQLQRRRNVFPRPTDFWSEPCRRSGPSILLRAGQGPRHKPGES